MHIHIRPALGGQLVQCFADGFRELILPGVGHAKGGHYANGVFIYQVRNLFIGEAVLAGVHGSLSHFHIPVAAELVPANLHRAAHQVRFIGGFAFFPAAGTPAPQRGHAAQHARLAGADGGATDGGGICRCMPQIGNHAHAALLNLCALRVLILINHVLAQAQIHELVDLAVAPRLAECCQILARVAIQQQFLADELIGIFRPHGVGRNLLVGQGSGHICGPENACAIVVFFLFHGYGVR